MRYEKKILKKYSSKRLKKNQLDRRAKKEHLAGFKVTGEEAEKILDEIYPKEK